MRKLKLILTAVIGGIFLSACSMSGSITSLDPTATSTRLDKASGGDFISGSGKTQLSLVRRYGIQASSGSWNGSIQNTTPRGYKVYSSIEGTMISSGQ
jgi:hypothetical protein